MAIGKLMAANKAANKVQNGTKITQFGVLHSTKKPRFINWLDETAKTAKPLCAGSIPTRIMPLGNVKSVQKLTLSTSGFHRNQVLT
jgi:hypothetical protein